MRRTLSKLASLMLIALPLQTASATTLNFSDMDMRVASWNEISKFGSVTESSALIVNSQAIQLSTSTQTFVAAYKNDISWTPAALGSITGVSASGTFFLVNTPVDFIPVLVQGGNVYAPPGVAPYLWEPPVIGVRQDHQWDEIPIDKFGREIGTGPSTPDFSAAPPIFFGFVGRRDGGGATYRFGNVVFNVVGVPETSGLISGAWIFAFWLANCSGRLLPAQKRGNSGG